MIKINYKEKSFVVEDKAQIDWCRSKNYGVEISGKTHLMNYETLYLIEKKQAKLVSKKKVSHDSYEYAVFKQLKKIGFVVKSGLKFGVSFRVYEKGEGEHASTLVEVVRDNEKIPVKNFSGKNRVAHSTKKKLLLAIVDKELSVTFIEMKWRKN